MRHRVIAVGEVEQFTLDRYDGSPTIYLTILDDCHAPVSRADLQALLDAYPEDAP